MNEKSGLTEKWKRKLASDGVQIDFEYTGAQISRNGLKSQKRLANCRNSELNISTNMGTSHTSLGNLIGVREGMSEPEAEFTETAQEIKIRKAAEKRARRAMQ